MLAHVVLSLAQPAQPASQLLSVTHKFEARAPDLAKALARRRDQAPPSNQRPLVFFHLRKSGGSQVRDALRDASRAHNLSSFIPCYNRVPCETYTPPRQMIYNRTAIGSPRYAVLAGHYVHESKPCMAGQRGPSVGLAEADRSSGACSGAGYGEPGRRSLPRSHPAYIKAQRRWPRPEPACVRPWQAGHLQYSGVEKWMWASSRLRGARVAHTALTQMGRSSRREGKPAEGNAAPLAKPDPAAEPQRFKALLQPALDAYAAGTIDSQQLDARRADARRRSTRRPPRPTREISREMSCVTMVRPTVDRVRSCWNYRFVQEDLQMVPEADASGQRRALNNVTRWKARHIGRAYTM